MYVPKVFKTDDAEAIGFLKERAFGVLVVEGADGPTGVQVPFLTLEHDDGSVSLELHVAHANPIHEVIGESCRVLLVCQGPDGYISPDWYGVADQVPTWAYRAVHVSGIAHVLPEHEIRGVVDRLSAHFEARFAPKKPWTSDKTAPEKLAAMTRAIVAIGIAVEAIDGADKLNQHKGETSLRGAATGLAERPDAGSREIGLLMAGLADKSAES
jgi:transcriptional regulator